MLRARQELAKWYFGTGRDWAIGDGIQDWKGAVSW